MAYFDGVTGETDHEVLKKMFRAMAKRMHPDVGGSTEEFNSMCREYNQLTGKDENIRDVDDLAHKAFLHIVLGVLQQHIGENPTFFDLFEEVRMIVKGKVEKFKKEIFRLEKQVEFYQLALDQISPRSGHLFANISACINTEINNIKNKIQGTKKDIKVAELITSQSLNMNYNCERKSLFFLGYSQGGDHDV